MSTKTRTKAKPLGTTAGEVREILALAIVAIGDGKLAPSAGNLISKCGNDFNALLNLELRFMKRGESLTARVNPPDLRQLRKLLEDGDFDAGVKEAKRIHELMRPIVNQAREDLKAS